MVAALAVWLWGVAVGIGTLLLVQRNQGGSLAGSTSFGGATLLVGGMVAITAGVFLASQRATRRFGVVLTLAGFAWFVEEWNNAGTGSSLVFTLGLLFYAAGPALVAQAALSYPGGRIRSRAEWTTLVVAYGSSLIVLGLGSALVFDPANQGCGQCATNLVTVADQPDLVASLSLAGVRLGAVWSIALTVLVAWRLVNSTPTGRRATAPVLVPAFVYLAAVAATYVHALDRGAVLNDSFGRRMWLVQAGALVVVVVGVVEGWLRTRRARSALAAMVVALGQTPPPGRLRAALAKTLGDPELVIAYPIDGGLLVDANGTPITVDTRGGRATTAVERHGETIALLVHRGDLSGDPRLVEETASAATLAFENERLQAETKSQLAELHLSRSRLVAASDEERRRLERDLHDGAQQCLVGLSLALRLTRTRLDPEADAVLAAKLDAAASTLGLAVEELRELASGIHPSVLTDLGIGAAIEALAESGTAPLRLVQAPTERLPAAVETAAYLVVAAVAKRGPTSVTVTRREDRLVMRLDAAGEPEHLAELEDRVAALDGYLNVAPTPDGVHIQAVIPCG